MNHIKDILLDEPCPDLICGICNDILDDPMQVHCSEDHMFCRRCINNYEKLSCPSCMEPLDKTGFQLSKFVKRQISRLRVRCIYKPLGCSWEGVLEDNHSASCNYQSIPCPNTHRGCTEKIGIMEIDRHRLECPYELLACPNNAQKCKPYLRKDIHIHNTQCSSFRCHFAHEGCSFTGTLVDVNQHVESYCGKLHGRIRELEMQCQQLKQQLDQQQQQQHQQQDVINSAINMPQQVDASMDEMTLFHQMFNNGFLGMNSDNTNTTTTLNDNNSNAPTISTTNSTTTTTIENNMNIDPNANLMNLTNLPTITPLTSTPSSDMNKDQMIIPDNSKDISSTNLMTAPKRSTNGKIIRYSKNKQLAHGALRMARQRTSSNGGLTTDAILNALHVASTSKSIDDEDINMKGSDLNLHPNINNSSLNNINTNNNHNHKNNLINKQKQQQPSSRNTSNRTSNNSNNSNNNNKTMDGSNKEVFAFKSLDDVTKFLEELPPIVEATPFLSPQHGRKPVTKHKSNSDRTNKSKMNSDSNSNANTRRQSKPSSSPSSSSSFNSSNNININPNDSHLNDVSHLSTPSPLPGTPMEVTGNVASPPSSVTSNTTPLRPMFVLASSFLSKNSQEPSVN